MCPREMVDHGDVSINTGGDSASSVLRINVDNLAPDYDDEEVLSSFPSIREKNFNIIYGEGADRSPKGSVDVLIQPLCDIINSHPSFCTLSSCSGRIALFDPAASKGTSSNNDGIIEQGESGKGHGTWLLASHEEVEDPHHLAKLLSEVEEATNGQGEALTFKHEPMLLHIAASNLERGQQMLSLALQCGFRESGLVVTDQRVTVAIRTTSLSLIVPLARQGSLRPSDAYLAELLKQANQKLAKNHEKMNQLEASIRQSVFTSPRPNGNGSLYEETPELKFQELPPLNLWGHASVCVPRADEDGYDILVFGGYGSGPLASKQRRCQRSSAVYKLPSSSPGDSSNWCEVAQSQLSEAEKDQIQMSSLGVEVRFDSMEPSEGLQACLLPSTSAKKTSAGGPVVALFGGRAGPTRPFDHLLLYDPSVREDCLLKPIQISGASPPARWGHSFTPLPSGKGGHLALLIGGRNQETSLSCVYLLSLVERDSTRSFHWTQLDTPMLQQFHHSVVMSPHDDDTFFVFGGLADPNDLLESFSDSHRYVGNFGSAFGRKRRPSQIPKRNPPVGCYRLDIEGGRCREVPLEFQSRVAPHYGGSCCSVLDSRGQQILVFAGGMQLHSSMLAFESDPIRLFGTTTATSDSQGSPRPFRSFEPLISEDEGDVSFAAMVHHTCVSLPQENEFLLLGGGMSSFAFGANFAHSYRAKLELKQHPRSSTEQRIITKRRSARMISISPSSSARRIKPPIDPNDLEDISEHSDDKPTTVLYVASRNAKAVKSALEANGWLDKRYRMTPRDDTKKQIAVPVTKQCFVAYTKATGQGGKTSLSDEASFGMIVGHGYAVAPPSTAEMGKRKQMK